MCTGTQCCASSCHASPAVHSASKQNMCAASYTGHKPASDSRSISSQELHALFPPNCTYNVCVNDVAWIETPSHAKLLNMPSSTAPFSLDSAVILAVSISTDGPSSHEAFRRPEFHQHRVSGRRNQKASSIICRGLRVRSLSRDEGTAPHTHGLDGQLMMMCYYLGQHPTK